MEMFDNIIEFHYSKVVFSILKEFDWCNLHLSVINREVIIIS